jgi:DNA-binding MarR family transcriptional regulator
MAFIGFDKSLYSCIIQLLNGCMEQLMTRNEVQVQVFQEQLMQFVRGLGLHRSDATPCGFPVSLAEACALVALTHNEPLSQRELVQALNLEKSTVSRLVVELIDRGWVVRERDAHDARVQLMRRTPAGVTASDAIMQARNQRFGELLGRIEPGRRQQVVDAMMILAEAVSDDSMATN